MINRQSKQPYRSQSLSIKNKKNTVQLPRFYSKPKNDLKMYIQSSHQIIQLLQQPKFIRKTQICQIKNQQISSRKPHSVKKIQLFDNKHIIKYSSAKKNHILPLFDKNLSSQKKQFNNKNQLTQKTSKINNIKFKNSHSQSKKKDIYLQSNINRDTTYKLSTKTNKKTSTSKIILTQAQNHKTYPIEQLITDNDKDQWLRIEELLKNMSRSINDIASAQKYIVTDRFKHQKKIYLSILDNKLKNKLRIHLAVTRITIYVYSHFIINTIDVKTLLNLIDKLYQSHKYFRSYFINSKAIIMNGESWVNHLSKSNDYVHRSLHVILSKRRIPQSDLFKNMLESSVKIQSIQFLGVIDKTLKWQILKMPSFPYLPCSQKHHSLVLDLDQTLIHFDQKTQTFHVRPFTEQFIIKISKYYQITVFTAATREYADEIINEIDQNNNISYRLYRNHLTFIDDHAIKDLSMLGRSLQHTIIVDNLGSNFRMHPENGILIRSWYGDNEDSVLNKLYNILVQIAQKYKDDVRIGLKQYQQYIKDQITISELIYQLKYEL